MKAPFSDKARIIFSDEDAKEKVMKAARKSESVVVEVDGNEYRVQPSSSRDRN